MIGNLLHCNSRSHDRASGIGNYIDVSVGRLSTTVRFFVLTSCTTQNSAAANAGVAKAAMTTAAVAIPNFIIFSFNCRSIASTIQQREKLPIVAPRKERDGPRISDMTS
jgi:hypothetical protein